MYFENSTCNKALVSISFALPTQPTATASTDYKLSPFLAHCIQSCVGY